MIRKLFLNKTVKIVDGDNRLDACHEEASKLRLRNLITYGMDVKCIQLFHYAAIKYNTRWNSYFLKYLNALFNSISTIVDKNDYFCLSDIEESELKRDSSEVIAIGLSNMFMCRWYNINANRIEKIQGSGKRCDFRFPYDGLVIIFESKGRSDSSQISSAYSDCKEKKKMHIADYKFSTIVHLPRNEAQVSLHLYDPPVYNDNVKLDEKYIVAKHYCRITELAGLTLLSGAIRKRIRKYEKTGVWDTKPLEYQNVYKIGTQILFHENSFWIRKEIRNYKFNDKSYYIQIGLHEDIIKLLKNWDLENLLKFSIQDNVNDKHNLSILSDGSLFFVGEKPLS